MSESIQDRLNGRMQSELRGYIIESLAYEVENNVPIPRPLRKRKLYPFKDMKVGQSFFVATTRHNNEEARISLYGARRYFCKTNPGMEFTMRQMEGGIRVWRTV